MTRHIAIFDLDGTLNSTKARIELVPDNSRDNKAWIPWHAAFALEELNYGLIDTAMAMNASGTDILVVSNRNDQFSFDTQKHLRNSGFPATAMVLRDDYDYRSTKSWKVDTIKNLVLLLREEVVIHHFDDDKPVLKSLTEYFRSNRPYVHYVPHLVEFK